MIPSAIVKMGLLCDSAVLVLADEERRRLPARQMKREPLHEHLQLALGHARVRDRAKRVDDDGRRVDLLDLGEHAFHDAAEVVIHRLGAEIDEPHRLADLLFVEEAVVLRVPQHLERRLAEHREVQGRRFGRRLARRQSAARAWSCRRRGRRRSG